MSRRAGQPMSRRAGQRMMPEARAFRACFPELSDYWIVEVRNDILRNDGVHALEMVNNALDGHGIEYLPSRQDTGLHVLGLEYVNFGDPYATTLVRDMTTNEFRISSWGDEVEHSAKRFGK